MNKTLMLVLAMLLVASVAFAQQNPGGQGPTVLNGGMTGTPGGFTGSGPNNQGGPGLGRHDLQDATTSTALGCETCHLPHTSPTYGTSFMWAWKNLPSNLPTYQTAYNSGGALVTPTGITGNSRSMLCFSCHDATSASSNGIAGANTFNGGPYPLVTTSGGTTLAGTGLVVQHPVDARVPTTPDYVQPNTTGTLLYGATATIGVDKLPLWGWGYGVNYSSTTAAVECGTCHDVHNDYTSNGGPGQGGIPFLRQSNQYGTYLCRECHNAQ